MPSQTLSQTPRMIPIPSCHPRRSLINFKDKESEAEQWSPVGASEQPARPSIIEEPARHHLHLHLPRTMVGFKICLFDLNSVQSKKHRVWARVVPVDGQLGADFLPSLHAQELSVLPFGLFGP